MASALLQAFSLPERWADQPGWRVLEIGFGAGQHFLAVWQAWRADPRHARMLHYVAIDPQPSAPLVSPGSSQNVEADVCSALSHQLAERCWGLTRGFHRFSFENGQVLLTLCIGAAGVMLREQRFEADSIWLGDDARVSGWVAQDSHAGKALARRCRRGTQLAGPSSSFALWKDVLRSNGFVRSPQPHGDAHASTDNFFGVMFDPSWTPRRRPVAKTLRPQSSADHASAIVIGAGIAGAAVAASLARRGLHVNVLDAHDAPALGTSSLPAGLLAPHLSADDGRRSRLSRAGLRAVIEFAQLRLATGRDWHLTGVLERRADAVRALSGQVGPASDDWSRLASNTQKSAAGLDAELPAVWHAHAGWIRPGALVRALLDDPRIAFQGQTAVHALQPAGTEWQAVRADGSIVAQATLVVLAAGHATGRLAAAYALPLQAVRGQLTWIRHPIGAGNAAEGPCRPIELPPFSVNGHGSLLPDVPLESGRACLFGATYGRDDDGIDVRTVEHEQNLVRLHELLSSPAKPCRQWLAQRRDGDWQGWAGVRAVAPDRLPMVGPLAGPAGDATAAQLERMPPSVCTALGSRGLSHAICCAELLAAQLFDEPLPVEPALADALDVQRFLC